MSGVQMTTWEASTHTHTETDVRREGGMMSNSHALTHVHTLHMKAGFFSLSLSLSSPLKKRRRNSLLSCCAPFFPSFHYSGEVRTDFLTLNLLPSRPLSSLSLLLFLLLLLLLPLNKQRQATTDSAEEEACFVVVEAPMPVVVVACQSRNRHRNVLI